jgi:hypothetical protein
MFINDQECANTGKRANKSFPTKFPASGLENLVEDVARLA